MPYLSRRASGESTRREITASDGFRYHKSEWLATGGDRKLSPTIFLVEQPPHSVLRPHFHTQNEFQVFVRGSGWMGKDAVVPYVVHYASAYTGYGPITAGPDGLAYFTIRAVLESGALFIPEDRETMVRGPKHQFHVPVSAALDATDRPVRGIHELASAQQGAVKIFSLRIPPHQSVAAPALGSSVAQFNMVLSGSLAHQANTLAPWEGIVSLQGDAPQTFLAGKEGAVVLSMLIDERHPVYGDRATPSK